MFACFVANAAPVVFKSSQRQTALVELYTSEGCSSCPPAESWLSGMKKASGLWSDFVPVAFHVEYWDNLGWRDKWSSKQSSDRQRDYAGVWGARTSTHPNLFIMHNAQRMVAFALQRRDDTALDFIRPVRRVCFVGLTRKNCRQTSFSICWRMAGRCSRTSSNQAETVGEGSSLGRISMMSITGAAGRKVRIVTPG